jgi:arylsulfatase A-like enzyme
MVTRRNALKSLAGAALAGPALAGVRPRPVRERPNLLFLWTDEQRADTLQVNGNYRFRMPVLNRLASESIVFSNAYVAQPVCSPSRGCVLTGLYPHQHGTVHNNLRLPRSTPVQPELLADSAYRTAYMGKWHLGDEVFAQHGFDEWVSSEDTYSDFFYPDRDGSTRSSYHHYLLSQGFKPDNTKENKFTREFAVRLPVDHCKPAFLARNASRFITENRNQPWLLHVNFLEPHMPFYGPYNDLLSAEEAPIPANYPGDQIDHEPELYRRIRKSYVDKGFEGQDLHSRPGWQRLNRNYAGMCAQVDEAFGHILWSLEASGQADNTIIVFTSDHGEMMGAHSLLGKSVFYEEAVHVPFFIRVPFLQSRQISIQQPVSHINLVPTVLDLLGKKAPENLNGESLLPLLDGGKLKEDHVFIEWFEEPDGPHGRTVVSPQGEKLVLFRKDNNMFFDRRRDPLELDNLYYTGQAESRITELHKRIDQWQKKTTDTLDLVS